ncbi:hypothetical protein K432DRAFT_270491, partial [Lepidopterella palustris CBS 459.81]
ASADGPEVEFHDPRRKELLQALKDALGDDTTIGTTVWACLWLSDIDRLEKIVAWAKETPFHVSAFFDTIELSTRVHIGTDRSRRSSAAPSPWRPSSPLQPLTPLQPSTILHPSPSQQPPLSQQPPAQSSLRSQRRNNGSDGQLALSRNKAATNMCCERDQRKCVLVKAGEPINVAHIYPFSMGYEVDPIKEPRNTFWGTLRYFWSEERVDAWHNAVFPSGTEVCYNLICLSPDAHAYWGRAYFAFKPISLSEDKKRLVVQFYWLTPPNRASTVEILQVPSLPKDSDRGPNSTMLFNHETGEKICSGHALSLTTDDPVTQPLPDRRLLEMQWFLHRVTAISGAAEPWDNFRDDSDDED